MRKNIYILLFLSILIIWLYFPIFNNFFQHDEWTAFAMYFTDKNFLSDVSWYFFRSNVAHYTPLNGVFFYLMFKFFGLNFANYAFVSIALQATTVYLIYLLISKLFNNKFTGLIISGLFAVNASSYQATTWVGTTVNTHGASIFGLLSILVYFKYIQNFRHRNMYLFVFSMVLLFISLLFKEITIAIFPILILIIFLLNEKIKVKQKIIESLKLFLSGLFYVLFRASMFFAPRGDIQEQIVTESQSIADLLRNFITFPAKIFSQGLIPTQLLLELANKLSIILPNSITGLPGTTEFDVFTQQIMLQIINWSIFILATLLIYKLYLDKNKYFKFVFFGFLFSVINSFIYIISPGRTGNIPVVDSRNIYFPAIGTTIFLVSVSSYYAQKYGRKVYIILIVFFLINLLFLNKELKFYADQGTERRHILEQIVKTYPDLPDKVVIYTESDTSYYGMPETEKIFPFELNFGYTLMTWYLPTKKYDNEMVKIGSYIHKITAQGYQEKDGIGFGYFRDIDKLKQTVKLNKLPVESIIAFRYNSKSKLLIDITSEVRNELNINNK
ncbi:MAG: hypothetical protein WC758_07125 [Candidatus Woesearchaeota archaeon]|jgi:hypothetical protein